MAQEDAITGQLLADYGLDLGVQSLARLNSSGEA